MLKHAIAPPPADTALPHLQRALDADAAQAVLARWLEQGDLSLVECHPVYIRYKPETNATIRYNATLERSAQRWELPVVARLFPEGRAAKAFTKATRGGTPESFQTLHDAPPVSSPMAVLDEFAAFATLFPIDPKLPGLTGFASDRLERLAGPPAPLMRDLVRYRPGRKAVVRLRAAEAGAPTMYAKHAEPALSAEHAAKARTFTNALALQGIHSVGPLAESDDGWIIYPDAGGRALRELRGTPAYLEGLHAVTRIVTAFHNAGVELPPTTISDERSATAAAARLLAVVLPVERERLSALAGAVDAGLAGLDDTLIPAHGDFYDDQVLIDERGDFAVIDVDEARLSHPALDAGNFLAQLIAESLRTPCLTTDRAIEHLREQWASTFGERELAVATATGLLKLAIGPFRRLESEWPANISALLDAATAALPQRSHPVATTAFAALALPGLPTALDPAYISRLAGITDASTLHGGEIVKHKPRRRALVRYTRTGEPDVYVKVFASDRALTVAERTASIASALPAGIVSPRLLGVDTAKRLVVIEDVPGVTMESRIQSGSLAGARAAGRALALLHGSGAKLERQHGPAEELTATRAQLAGLPEVSISLASAADATIESLARELGDATAWRFLPAHRDCHPGQILLDGERVGFVDLDDACLTDPAVDLGNLLAHLDLLGMSTGTDRVTRWADEILDGYTETAPLPAYLELLRAIALVRLVGVHAPRAGESTGWSLLACAQSMCAVRVPAAR